MMRALVSDGETMQDAQIRWRLRRGMKELDVLLSRWYEQHWPRASGPQRAAFVALLDCEDPDIWSWLMGYSAPPPGPLADVVAGLRR